MCAKIPIVLLYHFISAVQCSTILTRSMIRMPVHQRETPPEPKLQPIVLTNSEDPRYELIYPINYTKENLFDTQSRSLDTESATDFLRNNISKEESAIEPGIMPSKSDGHDKWKIDEVVLDHHINVLDIPAEQKENEDRRLGFDYLNDKFNSTDLIHRNGKNSENHSSDITPLDLSKIKKGFQDLNFWELIQRFLNCAWSSGWVSCFQEILRTSSDYSDSFLRILTPQGHPFVSQEDSSEEDADLNDKYDLESPDQDEGRKRFTKKIQSLIPLLIMLKMSMLPALAVMALVSGKAFLMSLISLGVALMSAIFSPSGILSASKRHEVAAESSISHDPSSSNYYYMM